MMGAIIGLLTRKKQDLIECQGLMKALSDFRLDFPYHYNPGWRLGKREMDKKQDDEANFLDGSATPKVGKTAGVAIARKKAIPICQSIRVTIAMGVGMRMVI
jgi:hypothetical protein